MKSIRMLLILSILVFMAHGASGNENDISLIKQRVTDPFIKAGTASYIQSLIDNQNADGSFPDVNYEDTNGGSWATYSHLSKILPLAQSYRADDSAFFGEENCKAAISKGLDYWFEKDFINGNWWWNQIGVPGRMANILLLFEDELSDEQRTQGASILARAEIRMTGANLVDLAFITVKRGLIENDGETVTFAVKSIEDEIKITTDEGIQADYSFHQHGALLYNHGYGAVLSSKCGETAKLVTGTDFAFSDEKIKLMTDLILEGTRWMVRKSTRDYGATGRGLTRSAGSSGSASYLGSIINTMLQLPTGREAEFTALKEQVTGTREASVTGNRHFWRGEIMTHHRENYYMSARMYSERMYNTDGAHNGEGLLSHYLGDGCTYIMQSGMEYHNIFPVWDWHKIPGTTVEIQPSFPSKINIKGEGTAAGGVSDGNYGVASFDFHRDSLSAKKSWFFFDDQIVCLGSGISSGTTNQVITTLNQCYLNGEVTVSASGKNDSVANGDHTLDSAKWIHHDNVAYLFLEPTKTRMSNQTESGSWKLITSQGSDATVEHELFTLWLEHGNQVDNASYAYTVMPGISSEQTEIYAANPSVRVIENSSAIQMVVHEKLGISGIVFHTAGEVVLTDGTQVTVDSPCIALLTKQDGGYDVSIADPECTDKDVTVTLKGNTGDTKEVIFDLPDGLFAGKTLTMSVSIKTGGVGINDISPGDYTLAQNSPNPFNPATSIPFRLSRGSQLSLAVYNITGEKVAELAKGRFSAGEHAVTWDASDYASGVYFYRIASADFVKTRKMMLVK